MQKIDTDAQQRQKIDAVGRCEEGIRGTDAEQIQKRDAVGRCEGEQMQKGDAVGRWEGEMHRTDAERRCRRDIQPRDLKEGCREQMQNRCRREMQPTAAVSDPDHYHHHYR